MNKISILFLCLPLALLTLVSTECKADDDDEISWKDRLKGYYDKMKGTAASAADRATEKAKDWVGGAEEWAEEVRDKAKEWASNLRDRFRGTKGKGEDAKDAAEEAGEKVVNFMQDLPSFRRRR